jgi:predicted permease
MRIFDALRFRIATLFHRAELNAELEEELRSHIGLRADDLVRSGMPRAEAERRARIEFGGQERFREECHEAAGGNFFETLISDARYSLRVLWKSPGFTTAAVLTLTLGIGANAVVFAVLDSLILRPLDVPGTESLFMVKHGHDIGGGQSYPDYLDLRDRNRTFDGLAAYSINVAGFDTGHNPSRTWLYEATGNYFDALRIQPYLGRFFHESDEHGPNSAPYLVLSYTYWHDHFQDDRNVLGRVVEVDKHPFTIIGVAPPGFHGTLLFGYPDFWIPMVNQEQVDGVRWLNARGTRNVFMTLGHLKPGVTHAQAVADLNAIGAYLDKSYPQEHGKTTYELARPELYGDYMGKPVKAFLTALMVLAGLILLAACANLGSLFAARAMDRSREVALRLALGSSRRRILRQLFTEALLISVAGGAFGLAGSLVLLRWLAAWQPVPRYPLQVPIFLDAKVYLVALFLAIASGFLFGIVPVRQVLRTDPYQIVKGGQDNVKGRRLTARDVLLVVQIAICAVLVTSSLVAVRGLVRSLHADFGFNPQNAMLVGTVLDMAGYRGGAVPVMQKRVIAALEAIPGVTSVGLIDWPPLANGDVKRSVIFTDDTTDLRRANAVATPVTFSISPDYFRASGTTLLEGRGFSWHDDAKAAHVAVVNHEFAKKLFGSSNAVGRYFKQTDGTRTEILGIVEDGKYHSLTEDTEPAIFLPFLQSAEVISDTTYVLRSDRDPQQIAVAVQSTMRELDPGLPYDMQTWTQELDLALFAPRVATISLGVLGVMGAILSITGIFGMAAYSVSRRLRELGIRIALGAQRREVLEAALGRALKLLACGSIAGLLLGLLATRVLAFIVYQASPRDPVVLAGVVFAMALLGLLATWIPAQRALSVDPLRLLREE